MKTTLAISLIILLTHLIGCKSENNKQKENSLESAEVHKVTINLNQQFTFLSGLKKVPFNERNIGFGFNEVTTEWSGAKAVEFNDDNDLESIGTSQDIEFMLKKVESYSSLREILGIDAHLSLGFAVFSSDIAMSLYSNSFISKFKQYILVQVNVYNSPQILKTSRLTTNATEIAQKGYKPFIENYGTRYVIGKITGGKLYGLIEIESFDEENYKSVTSSIDASIGVWGQLDGTFTNNIKKIAQNNSLKITLFKSGGNKSLSTTPEELINAAKQFPNEVSSNSKVQYLLLSKFNGVDNYPAEFSDTYYDQRLNTVLQKQERLAEYLEDWKGFQNDLNYINSHQEQFENKIFDNSKKLRVLSENGIQSYLDLNSTLVMALMNGKNINYNIKPTEIPEINRKSGWNSSKKEIYVKTLEVPIKTENRHNFPVNNYSFHFKASNDKNILKNVRIENCIDVGGNGACNWNAGSGYFSAITASYPIGKGFSEVIGNFNAGSHQMTLIVKCDEYELK